MARGIKSTVTSGVTLKPNILTHSKWANTLGWASWHHLTRLRQQADGQKVHMVLHPSSPPKLATGPAVYSCAGQSCPTDLPRAPTLAQQLPSAGMHVQLCFWCASKNFKVSIDWLLLQKLDAVRRHAFCMNIKITIDLRKNDSVSAWHFYLTLSHPLPMFSSWHRIQVPASAFYPYLKCTFFSEAASWC